MTKTHGGGSIRRGIIEEESLRKDVTRQDQEALRRLSGSSQEALQEALRKHLGALGAIWERISSGSRELMPLSAKMQKFL